MKIISCVDLGINCPWVGRANNIDDLTSQVKKHMQEDHPEYWQENMKNMSDEELKNMIRQYAKDEEEE